MNYIPHTAQDRQQMQEAIGASSLDNLFADIPASVRLKEGAVRLPAPLSELELKRHLQALAEKNCDLDHFTSFLGAGAYHHFIPATVKHVIQRSEFYTAYTSYQPEVSQGILQSIYEYQTMICNLTGMDVANASLYDGATALAEAALLAHRVTQRSEIIVSEAVHPEYRAVLKTYARGSGLKITEIPFDSELRTLNTDLRTQITNDSACVIIQQPNFFGCLEEIEGLADLAHDHGALFIVSADPISLGILKPPGEYGADIVVGEGQSLGIPLAFGGPYLGIFAARDQLKRQLPGRVVGMTTDPRGQRGFVLTLQTREQHIRRERATSNICTNEALCALAATVYLATMGKRGLRQVAELCLQKTNYLKGKLKKLKGFSIPSAAPTFKEFVLKTPGAPARINKALLKHKIIGGLNLDRFYPKLKNHMLFSATEMVTREEMDQLVDILTYL